MKDFLEWLSTPEGPELVDTHSDPPTTPDMAMAVGLDPEHLYQNPPGAVAGIGLVYKPCYINTMPFDSASEIIEDYLVGSSKKLARPCLLFLSISEQSTVFPYAGDNPFYIDVASKERAEARPTGGKLGDFRSFMLPRVMAKRSKNSPEYSYCTSYPRHPGGHPTLINPLAPRRKNEAFLKEMLCYPMALASPNHWAFSEDTEFENWVSSLEEDREKSRAELGAIKSEKQDKNATPEAPSGGTTAGGESNPNDEEVVEVSNNDMEVEGEASEKTPRKHTRPLRSLMDQAGLTTRTPRVSNIPEPETIVLDGDGAPEGASPPTSNVKAVEALLERLRTLQLQALFEMGCVRVVDRVSAELLMANFAHVNLVMGEDLNRSLRSLVDVTKGACTNLLADIKTALGPTLFSLAETNINRAIGKYHQQIDSSVTQTLVYLDCARRDARVFLRDRASNLKSDKEFKEMLTALSERLSNHTNQVQEVILSSEMDDPRVNLKVNAALSTTQPVVTNYFGGVLEGLMGSLSLSPSTGEGSAQSVQEGIERRVAVALQRQSSQGGIKLQGLHVDYSHDFATRSVGASIPALSSTAVPNLLETMDRLRSNLPPVPERSRPMLKDEPLFQKFLEAQPDYKGDNAEVHQLSQVLSQLYEEFKKKKEEGEPEDKGKPNSGFPTPPKDATPPSLPDDPPTNSSPGKLPNLNPQVQLQRTNVTGVLNPGHLPDPSSKYKEQQSSHKESEDSLSALSNGVDNSVDSGISADLTPSKEESKAKGAVTRKRNSADDSQQGPTPKKANLGRLFDGVVVKHDPPSSVTFFCKFSAKKGSAGRTQSLSDEEGEETSSDEEDQKDKVTSAPFASDEDLNSPEAKRKSLIPPPKPSSKKVEQKSKGTSEEVTTQPNQKGEECSDDSGDSDSGLGTGVSGKEEVVKVSSTDNPALVKARLKKRMDVYQDDRTMARLVRGSIMGLKTNQEPTQEAIESNKTFKLRGPKEAPKGITNISKHWVSRLADLSVLGEAPIEEFVPREGWPQVYTWSDFAKHAPAIASGVIWGRKGKPSLVVIVPADSLELPSHYFLSLLHKEESITRKSVYYFEDPTDKERTRVQYCFCAYCGVLSMNRNSGYSHLRKHLGVEFLCGGCLSFKDSDPSHINDHMETCSPCVKARGGAEFAPLRRARRVRAK